MYPPYKLKSPGGRKLSASKNPGWVKNVIPIGGRSQGPLSTRHSSSYPLQQPTRDLTWTQLISLWKTPKKLQVFCFIAQATWHVNFGIGGSFPFICSCFQSIEGGMQTHTPLPNRFDKSKDEKKKKNKLECKIVWIKWIEQEACPRPKPGILSQNVVCCVFFSGKYPSSQMAELIGTSCCLFLELVDHSHIRCRIHCNEKQKTYTSGTLIL